MGPIANQGHEEGANLGCGDGFGHISRNAGSEDLREMAWRSIT